MPLRLLLNGEGNEIGMVEDVAARIVGGRVRGEGVLALGRRMMDVAIESVEIILLHELFRVKAQCGTELWDAQLAD
ncbi:hypothetical protein GOBAR_AA36046 [Gossypium barbadense]|uniref:Uncharacterized protein n=1 Tax=Gossypium barbadense TaxID=3634 RepID=A0A2P5W0Q6_GOSBA|nr:hypothetical protein GOBAR_AA36046 [Gossypium barbadense]